MRHLRANKDPIAINIFRPVRILQNTVLDVNFVTSEACLNLEL